MTIGEEPVRKRISPYLVYPEVTLPKVKKERTKTVKSNGNPANPPNDPPRETSEEGIKIKSDFDNSDVLKVKIETCDKFVEASTSPKKRKKKKEKVEKEVLMKKSRTFDSVDPMETSSKEISMADPLAGANLKTMRKVVRSLEEQKNIAEDPNVLTEVEADRAVLTEYIMKETENPGRHRERKYLEVTIFNSYQLTAPVIFVTHISD